MYILNLKLFKMDFYHPTVFKIGNFCFADQLYVYQRYASIILGF